MIINSKSKIAISLLIVMLLVLVFNIGAVIYATTDGSGTLGSSGITWTYTAEDKTLVISATEGSGVMPDYTSSNKPPFSGKGFTKVIIEEGVTSIGKYTFYDNRNIESVEIASTVKVISDYAFQGYGDKSKLSTIIGMEGVETIGKFAFEGSKITELNVPSLLAVGDNAFSSIYSGTSSNQTLVSVNAPNLTTVGKEAFYNQDNLTTFYAPNLTSIGERAFEGSEDLTDLTIGQSAIIGLFAFKDTPVHADYPSKYVVNIGKVNPEDVKASYNDYTKELVIYGTGQMRDFTGPDRYSNTGSNLITGSYPVNKVLIEDGVENIGDYAFYSYYSGVITDVTLPSTLKTIGNKVFINQKVLETINFENVETVGVSAFEGTKKITSLNAQNLISVGDYAFEGSKLIELTAPSLTSIGQSAFRNVTTLTTINAPNLTSIGQSAFEGDTNLSNVVISESAEIGLYAFKGTPVHSSYQGKKILEIGNVVPSDVIAEYNDYSTILAIKGLGDMQDFTSSNNLYTRLGVSGIDKVVIEEGVTSIGAYMFYDTAHIDEVHIADSVKKIGRAAFSEMRATAPKGLLIVTGMGGVEEISPSAFSGSSNITTFPTIFMSLKIVGDSAFSGVKITSLDAKNLETVGKNAFNNTSLTTVYAPKLTSVGERAFYNLSNLSSFTAPLLTSVGTEAFRNISTLTSFTAPLLTSDNIGLNAFSGTPVHEQYPSERIIDIGKVNPEDIKAKYNDYTKELVIYGVGEMKDFETYKSSTLTTIYGYSTLDKYPVEKVIIEEGITNIGNNAFTYSDSTEYTGYKITEISIPNTLTKIGNYAFRDQNLITTIDLGNVEIIGDNTFFNCRSLSSLNAQLLKSIGNNAFQGTKLSAVNTPLLTSVGTEAFRNISTLTSFTAPLLTSDNIGVYAFLGTPVHTDYPSKYVVNIGKVNPEDVKIEYNDYSGQARIYGIGEMQDFDANTSTGMSSRNNCLTGSLRSGYTFTSVIIEEGVKNIGANAFLFKSGNIPINSIVIPSSILSISDRAFYGQTQLTTIQNSSQANQTVGSNVFNNTGTSVTDEVVYLYSTNTNFDTAIPLTYTRIYLDDYTPEEKTLEEWLEAGLTLDSWFETGNTIDDFIADGGTAESWVSYSVTYPYLWGSYSPVGGWGLYGGTGTSWTSTGGTLGSWSAAGGSVEEYQAEVSEEEEDEEQNSNLINVYVDESKVVFPDTQPIVANERILVPVRFIMEELGFEVNWDDVNKKAVMRKVESDGRKLEVIMRPNQSTMTVNGKEYSIGATIQVAAPGRLMLPGGELVITMQDIFYKEEKLSTLIYEGYYYSEDTVGTEPKLADIPVIEDFTDNPNLIELTPENEETILDDEVSMTDILLTAEATNFRATVPFKVDVYMDKMGVITIGEGYKITNQCPLGQIVIVDFEITTVGGWTLVDISENFKAKKINTKEFGLSVNGATALNGSVPLNTSLAEPIRNRESKDLVFDVKIPGQTTEVNQVISSLSIVLDFWK